MPEIDDRLAADVDPRLLDFLQRTVNSFVKWDLVRFFYHNPHTVDTADNIARHVGRSVETTRDEVVDLARHGVLAECRVGSIITYSLSEDASIQQLLHHLVEAADDPLFRLKAFYQIIRAVRNHHSPKDNGAGKKEEFVTTGNP